MVSKATKKIYLAKLKQKKFVLKIRQRVRVRNYAAQNEPEILKIIAQRRQPEESVLCKNLDNPNDGKYYTWAPFIVCSVVFIFIYLIDLKFSKLISAS
jgi:hypothetical protein